MTGQNQRDVLLMLLSVFVLFFSVFHYCSFSFLVWLIFQGLLQLGHLDPELEEQLRKLMDVQLNKGPAIVKNILVKLQYTQFLPRPCPNKNIGVAFLKTKYVMLTFYFKGSYRVIGDYSNKGS